MLVAEVIVFFFMSKENLDKALVEEEEEEGEGEGEEKEWNTDISHLRWLLKLTVM